MAGFAERDVLGSAVVHREVQQEICRTLQPRLLPLFFVVSCELRSFKCSCLPGLALMSERRKKVGGHLLVRVVRGIFS